MKEEFKYIKIHNKKLKVSNLGRVFRDGVELRQNINHDNYKVVYVGNNRSVGVHRLVALAFIENDDPKSKTEVNHLDFDRQNNVYTNLNWLSHKDNVKYSQENNRYNKYFGEDNPNYGNRKLSKFYKENPDIALEKQSRKGAKNGKATPIKLFKDNVLVEEFDYIGDCCEYLHVNHGFPSNPESIRCSIRASISKNRPYRGFTFEKTNK